MKKLVAILAIIIVAGGIIGGLFIYRHSANTIGKDAALSIALEDAGFDRSSVYDIDTDYEKESGSSYYEVEFKTGGMEYKYVIDAKTGSILGSSTEPD